MIATDFEDVTNDALTARVRVVQRRTGHRYSFDDVVTAWVAARAAKDAHTHLDLGCGLGSVLLMVADRLEAVRSVGIEAQQQSFALARHNVEQSWMRERVQVVLGDLRRSSLGAEGAVFDLITGTPPYKKPGTATPSPDAQRAHARIELRGGVEDYLAAAGELLAPHGTCVVCMESAAGERVHAGARAAGLHVTERLDVIPIAGGKGRLFSVFTSHRAEHVDLAQPLAAAELVLRDASGARTEAACELRRFFGLGDPQAEPPSPPRRVRVARGPERAPAGPNS